MSGTELGVVNVGPETIRATSLTYRYLDLEREVRCTQMNTIQVDV